MAKPRRSSTPTRTRSRRVKKSNRGRRYGAEEKKKILDTARRENLTGQQAAKRFGVSTLTFYRWRGPVSGRRRVATSASRGHGAVEGTVRGEVRSRIQKMIPRIVREEVDAYFGDMR